MAKWLKSILTVMMVMVLVMGSSLMIAGCDKDPDAGDAVEQAEDAVGDAADAAGDAVDDAGDAVDDALSN
ncbi:MAG: hypothetical protein JW936_06750 [Sedimentisphaerales bacterium]|nr:hypothetical protein [Sedimentisphaerales bacterium]